MQLENLDVALVKTLRTLPISEEWKELIRNNPCGQQYHLLYRRILSIYIAYPHLRTTSEGEKLTEVFFRCWQRLFENEALRKYNEQLLHSSLSEMVEYLSGRPLQPAMTSQRGY